MALALARCGSGSGSCLALEKSTSPGSPCLPRVSRLYCHASRVLAGATPPWHSATVSALSASSHSQRPHHRLLLPARQRRYSHSGRTPCRCTADTARSALCSDKAWVPRYVHARPRRSSQEAGHGHRSSTLGGTYLVGGMHWPCHSLHAHTPPPPHLDAKYIARSLAGLHQP